MTTAEQLAILKQGVKVWNEWREDNPKVKIDLSGSNLSGRNLSGSNLSGANLSNVDFNTTNLCDANLSNSQLQYATFSQAKLQSTNFNSAKLNHSTFDEATTGVKTIQLLFQSVIFFLLLLLLEYLLSLIILCFIGTWSWFAENSILSIFILITAVTCATKFIDYTNKKFREAQRVGSPRAQEKSSVRNIKASIILVFTGLLISIGTGISFIFFDYYYFADILAIYIAFLLLTPIPLVFAEAGNISGYSIFIILVLILMPVVTAGTIVKFDLEKTYFWVYVFCSKLSLIYGFSSIIHNQESNSDYRLIIINYLNFFGTNFQNADLSYVSFKKAKLKGCDFRNSIFKHTDFTNADFLHLCRQENPESSPLSIPAVRNLLKTTEGEKGNFKNVDFQGINLRKCNLKGANLAASTVKSTDFYRATLTGACINDWTIDENTLFDEVKCDYIFRGDYNEEIKQYTHRLPVNAEQNFKDGEFAEWIKIQAKAQRTIDLTFTDGLDWQAFFQSFQEVREQFPDSEVRLQGIEQKGSTFLVRLETAPEADQGAIESTQKELYELQLQLREAQGEIKVLREMSDVLKQLAGRPMTKNEINIQNAANVANEVQSQKAIQHIYAEEKGQTPAESAKEIQDLLLQLQQTNPTDIQSLVEQRVKSDPTFRQRIKNALKEGGLETMKVIFPLTGIAIETVRGWVEAEGD